MKEEEKMVELINSLKRRNNASFKFFENLLGELRGDLQLEEARERLVSSFAITQYGEFTAHEEKLLGEIIDANL